jgi:selenophosphate synthetase-related protein
LKSLDEIVRVLHNFDGISRKYVLPQIITRIREESYKGGLPDSLGEDCAVIEIEKDEVVLITTDSIVEELCLNHPRAAGFNVVLANAMDIYAAGGVPTTISIAVSYSEPKVGDMLFRGLIEGSQKFRIPIVRGHTNPRSKFTYVVGSATGRVRKRDVLSAGGAKSGDLIALVFDKTGRRGSSYPLGWDSVVERESEVVLRRLSTMNELARQHLVNASKDVSVAGLVGTAGMLLEYSGKGGAIDLNEVERACPSSVEFEDWIRMYISLGFLLTISPNSASRVAGIASEHGMTSEAIGSVDDSRALRLKRGSDEQVLFDFSKAPVLTPRSSER